MKKIWEFIASASQSRTTALLVILVIGASIPLTVLVAQRQQNIQQKAAGGECRANNTFCNGSSLCTCGSDGTWSDASCTACTSGVCNSTVPAQCATPTPTPATQSCTPGTYFCSGANICYCNPSGVSQCNVCNNGASCSVIGGTPTCPSTSSGSTSTAPAAPTFMSPGYTGGCGSITLTWGGSGGATSYLIKRYDTVGVPESASTASYTTSSTSYTVTGLNSNPLTAYFFNIYAVNSAGQSPKVSVLAATGYCSAPTTIPTQQPTTIPTSPPSGNIPSACAQFSQYCTVSQGSSSCNWASIAGTPGCTSTVTSFYQSCLGSSGDLTSTINAICQSSTTGGTTLSLTIGLSGIGSVGDRVNPNANSASNKSPKSTIATTVHILNGTNYVAPQTNATLTYDSSLGKYIGSANIAGTIQSGSYTVKISNPGHLKKSAGTLSIATGQTTQVSVNLFAGDIDGDNDIDIFDHKILLGCSTFASPTQKVDCAGKSSESDLNLDGKVDQFDYNLWLREFKTGPRQGD